MKALLQEISAWCAVIAGAFVLGLWINGYLGAWLS